MQKTRDLFKKIRDTKGTFPEKAMATHSSTLPWKIPWMEEGSGWGVYVYLWRICFDVWQN